MYQKYIRQKITASLESLTVYRLIPLNKNFELRSIEFGRLLTFRPYNDIGVLNPDKAGLFEGSFSWAVGQFDPPPPSFIFQEELI